MTTRSSIDGALLAILRYLGGSPVAADQPAGMTAAQIVARLHGEEREPPEFFALVPLGYWLCDMIAFFGGTPAVEAAGPAAAQLLRVLRGSEGRVEAETDTRYPGDILMDILGALPTLAEIERLRGKTTSGG
jgi:hypothetical protein